MSYTPTRAERNRVAILVGAGLTPQQIAATVLDDEGRPLSTEDVDAYYGDVIAASGAQLHAKLVERNAQLAFTDGPNTFPALKWMMQNTMGWSEKRQVEQTGTPSVIVVPADQDVDSWIEEREDENEHAEPPQDPHGSS